MRGSNNVAVRLEGLVFDYRFNESDLRQLFAQIGQVTDVMLLDEIAAPDVAIIEFSTPEMAAKAVSDLDGAEMNVEGFTAVVRVAELSPDVERALLVHANIVSSSIADPDQIDPFRHNDRFSRYVARYLVGADKMSAEYSIIGRIVGAGGDNVKSIYRSTGAHVKVLGKPRSVDDPLYVRVSAESKEAFEKGKQLTEQLIQQTYDDYKQWCQRHYLPVPAIQLNVVEGSETLRPIGRLATFFFH